MEKHTHSNQNKIVIISRIFPPVRSFEWFLHCCVIWHSAENRNLREGKSARNRNCRNGKKMKKLYRSHEVYLFESMRSMTHSTWWRCATPIESNELHGYKNPTGAPLIRKFDWLWFLWLETFFCSRIEQGKYLLDLYEKMRKVVNLNLRQTAESGRKRWIMVSFDNIWVSRAPLFQVQFDKVQHFSEESPIQCSLCFRMSMTIKSFARCEREEGENSGKRMELNWMDWNGMECIELVSSATYCVRL